MSAKCQLTPCENCAENLAYSPAAAVYDGRFATVTWAAQRQAYELGEVALGHVCMCLCMMADLRLSRGLPKGSCVNTVSEHM